MLQLWNKCSVAPSSTKPTNDNKHTQPPPTKTKQTNKIPKQWQKWRRSRQLSSRQTATVIWQWRRWKANISCFTWMYSWCGDQAMGMACILLIAVLKSLHLTHLAPIFQWHCKVLFVGELCTKNKQTMIVNGWCRSCVTKRSCDTFPYIWMNNKGKS